MGRRRGEVELVRGGVGCEGVCGDLVRVAWVGRRSSLSAVRGGERGRGWGK